jgi:hypothetical protein
MVITVYEITTGKIIKVVISNDITYSFNPDTQSYLEGSFDGNKYYIQDSQPIEIPPAPNEYCVFDYDTKQWVDPRTNETQWAVVRSQRDALLAASDWTQLLDINIPNKSAWAVYRQNLRDITKQADPFNIAWPIPPAS